MRRSNMKTQQSAKILPAKHDGLENVSQASNVAIFDVYL